MTHIGYGSLLLSLFVSLYATFSFIWGGRQGQSAWQQSARNAMLSIAALVTLTALCLFYLLVVRDLSVRYVYDHVGSYQPLVYTLSAFWAGQEGSLLLWFWLLALLAGLIALRPRVWGESTWSYLLAVIAGLEAFLAFLLVTQSNPFAVLNYRPVEGLGMNPLLQNFWMIIHPPVVFMGYALYSVPFALVVAGLVSGELDASFWAALRRWNLYGWLFLGAGILLGAWWAYLELGWGGYWGWDPVENSSLVPWLTGTALLHTAIAQERRGMYRLWMLLLTAMTFLLCLFATFVTRSGVIQSVHAFGRSSIGYLFLAFMAALAILVGALLYRRRAAYASEYEVTNLLSREASFFLVNLLLLGMALVILLGTILPTLSEALRGTTVVLDASFYIRVSAPLFVALFALLGICPLLSWGDTLSSRLYRRLGLPLLLALLLIGVLFALGVRHPFALLSYGLCALIFLLILAQFLRDGLARRRRTGASYLQSLARAFQESRRRYGAHIVHLGLVLIAVGVTGSSTCKSEQFINLREGESAPLKGYVLTYLRAIQARTPAKLRNAAVVELSRDSRRIAYLTPEKNLHWSTNQWVTEVAIHSNLLEDVYLILGGLDENGKASFQVLLNPLVIWIWIGGFMLLLGTGIAVLSPSARRIAPKVSLDEKGEEE